MSGEVKDDTNGPMKKKKWIMSYRRENNDRLEFISPAVGIYTTNNIFK